MSTPTPVPPGPPHVVSMWDALAVAVAFAMGGVLLWFLTSAFGWEHAVPAGVALGGVGAAFLARAWWIGPVCARMDRIAAILLRNDPPPPP